MRVNLRSNLKIKKLRKRNTIKKEISKQRNSILKQNLKNVDLIIGMDNGTTGTWCSWLYDYGILDFVETFSKRTLNYQQQINYIDRIDHELLKDWIKKQVKNAKKVYNREIKVIIVLQRPMVNPQRFDSSLLAVRAFESTIIILQQLELNYIILDSKKWQHYFFGKETMLLNLKYESLKKGLLLLNEEEDVEDLKQIVKKHGDADALLITKFAIEKLIKHTKENAII